jgi:hypothetical protein
MEKKELILAAAILTMISSLGYHISKLIILIIKKMILE